MARNTGKHDTKGEPKGQAKGKLEDDVDALYRLPLAEFTAARNTLAGQLKKSVRGNEAEFVKTLAKPPISAWAVNQLYWRHHEAFERLIATGERFRQAQTSRHASKVTEMREALDSRRDALSHLSDLATTLLREAGHNPTFETIRRITTTLEAISAYSSLSDGPQPGRLTDDVDPPGFESLASWVPAAGAKERTTEPTRLKSSTKSERAAASTTTKAERAAEARQLEATRQAKLADAKAALQEAKRLLTEMRARQKSLDAAQRKAHAAATEAEKQRREAEQRFNKARAASEDASQRARSIKTELGEASKEVKDGERAVEKASKELELLFREPPGK
jgi:hypothetical protein